ncbi:lysine 2,3-aminomutase [Chitinophaga oryzae]|uniref:Lysine 2,3-aminomutase n=1 Tax=Chitinophaga oryzae TaxID=2725414 RepID=A0AAE6ZEN9_9BACT|nr:lysine 2,3-aminomutase [Chitinophaga oryzae]QJB30487.1 lysine 2,3-aminomutase [Chitinophaga oryzae]
MQYQAYSINNFRKIPEVNRYLSKAQVGGIELVGNIFPFKVNNYIIEELINWDNVPDDPVFRLVFPQEEMLRPYHYQQLRHAIGTGLEAYLRYTVRDIRLQLNPHPAGQMDMNVPYFGDACLDGTQHKYDQTVLLFPAQGQSCHAYCSFCFRWPQFVGAKDMKFSAHGTQDVLQYLRHNKQVTDVLITGGDPMVMRSHILRAYIEPLLGEGLEHITTIRIGTKSLSFWPYRYVSDPDADDLIRLFDDIQRAGKHLSFMAHFNHPAEMKTAVVRTAIQRIRSTGAVIRTQAPLMRTINDEPKIWADLWKKQVNEGCVPYYMFVARDTGAQHHFGIPLTSAWSIYQKAVQRVSGIARTVRGPSMSAGPGKILVNGFLELEDQNAIVLSFLQGRNPDWVNRPFLAAYDDEAIWIDDLRPLPGRDEWFWSKEYNEMCVSSRYAVER